MQGLVTPLSHMVGSASILIFGLYISLWEGLVTQRVNLE